MSATRLLLVILKWMQDQLPPEIQMTIARLAKVILQQLECILTVVRGEYGANIAVRCRTLGYMVNRMIQVVRPTNRVSEWVMVQSYFITRFFVTHPITRQTLVVPPI